MAVALLAAGLLAAGQASAASLPPGCGQSGLTVTCTYSTQGAEGTFTVPTNVSGIHVVATGAHGGGLRTTATHEVVNGGEGSRVTADLSVTPGSTLFTEVGIGGGAPFGGGESDVRTCSATVSACQAALGTAADSRLVVAGGGGGASFLSRGGGDGGDAALFFVSGNCRAGGPGIPGFDRGIGFPESGGGGVGGGCTGGGAGGSPAPEGGARPGFPGTARSGGAGGPSGGEGGGGGGGFFGGGGGGEEGLLASAGGGGGGSSFGPSGAVFALPPAGSGPQVVISYQAPVTSKPPSPPSPTTPPARASAPIATTPAPAGVLPRVPVTG